ncbi:MAG TPA: hypothetical protein VF981_15155 [Gemmatimonadaceae bacterium]
MKAVKDPEPDPKVGKPRAKSGVAFPYWDLDSAIEVAQVMHDRAGGSCDNVQLAALLGYSGVSNGSFRTRVSAAKMFGIIEDTDDGRLRVSARGRTILSPVTPSDGQRARVEAFLAVDLFRRVFDRFHGGTLPEQVGLRNLLSGEYQVVPDRVAPTVRILLDSAQQAGLFDMAGNRTRMVMPVGVPAAASSERDSTPAATPASPPNGTTPKMGGGGGGGGGDGSDGIDPAIVGLLRRLPPGGTAMTEKRRKALIDAFTNVIEFLYPDVDDGTL